MQKERLGTLVVVLVVVLAQTHQCIGMQHCTSSTMELLPQVLASSWPHHTCNHPAQCA